VPVDLIVPEAVAPATAGAALASGHTATLATRWAVGLEAALVDHSTMTIAALDPADSRSVTVEVAGMAAMLVAKSHKIRDRLADKKADRLSESMASSAVRPI